METRSATLQVRKGSGDEWVVEGIAVPWDQTIEIDGYKERFERGAFDDAELGLLYAEHGHTAQQLPIGRIAASENRDTGQWISAPISQTSLGRDVYTLLRDGVLAQFSVGFVPVEQRDDNGVIVRTKAKLPEVSVVGIPAYLGATVTAVRSATTPTTATAGEETMTTITTPEADPQVAELRTQLEDLQRRVEMQASAPGATGPAIASRSLAHFVKALADRRTAPAGFDPRAEAEALTRAYEGAVLGDTGTARPTWIDRDIKLVQENRDVLNLFSKQPLPTDGMSVEYPKFKGKSGDVAEQVAEGDDLTYLELELDEGNAPVRTYGGYSSLSRQAIERASVPYLAKVIEMQKISYAKVTNGIIRALLSSGANGATYNQLALPAAAKARDYTDLVIDGVGAVHDQSIGLEADFWLMSLAQFKALAHIEDTTGRPVFVVNGDGSNTWGNVNVKTLRANVGGLEVIVDRGLTGQYSYQCSANALTVLESAGAPWHLNDENIINLTKDFSLYGYLAATLNDAKGLVRVDHGI